MPAARWWQPETYCNNYNRRSTLLLIRNKMRLRTSQLWQVPALTIIALALPFSLFAQQQPSTVIKPPPPPAATSTPAPAAPVHHGVIAEEIVARVNNDIITLSDYAKAEQALRHDVTEECQGCSPERLETMYKEKQKDLLRDLIDQQLLAQRGKDEGISVEAEVIKQLDEVRKQNNLASLDDLEKAVE